MLRSCTWTLLFADGGTGFQFLRQTSPPTPAGEVANRICLLGGWQSVQRHDSFLLSGEASGLLGLQGQYAKVEAVHHTDSDRHDVQSSTYEGALDVDIFVVKK